MFSCSDDDDDDDHDDVDDVDDVEYDNDDRLLAVPIETTIKRVILAP